MLGFAKKLFGSSNDRSVKGMLTRVQSINALEPSYVALSDADLRGKTEEFKAQHPLADSQVSLVSREDQPGMYDARFMIRPHYQLEGISVALRLLSRMPTQ